MHTTTCTASNTEPAILSPTTLQQFLDTHTGNTHADIAQRYTHHTPIPFPQQPHNPPHDTVGDAAILPRVDTHPHTHNSNNNNSTAITAVKSLCLSVRDQPLLVVLRLEDRLDLKKVAAILGLPNRAVRLAPESQVPSWTGYCVGCVPPIGHRKLLPTIVDAAVTAVDRVAGGGGALDMQLQLSTTALLHLSAAHVADVAVGTGGGGGVEGGDRAQGGSGVLATPGVYTTTGVQ